MYICTAIGKNKYLSGIRPHARYLHLRRTEKLHKEKIYLGRKSLNKNIMFNAHESRLQTKQKIWQLLVALGWPFLSLFWDSHGAKIAEIWWRQISWQMSEYTWLVFSNNAAHVTVRNVLRRLFWILWLLLHSFAYISISFKLFWWIRMFENLLKVFVK